MFCFDGRDGFFPSTVLLDRSPRWTLCSAGRDGCFASRAALVRWPRRSSGRNVPWFRLRPVVQFGRVTCPAVPSSARCPRNVQKPPWMFGFRGRFGDAPAFVPWSASVRSPAVPFLGSLLGTCRLLPSLISLLITLGCRCALVPWSALDGFLPVRSTARGSRVCRICVLADGM